MPFCENEGCDRKGLKKEEIEIDGMTNKVVCRPCYTKKYGATSIIPVAMDRQNVGWGVHLTSDEGFKAEVRVGDVQLQLSASNEDLKEILREVG